MVKWQHLIAVRAVVGLSIDVMAIASGTDGWPPGYAATLTTGSGVIGYWYAWRLEQRPHLPVTRWRALLVWVGTAPEALLVVILSLWLIGVLTIALLQASISRDEIFAFLPGWIALSATTVAQALATCLWARHTTRCRPSVPTIAVT